MLSFFRKEHIRRIVDGGIAVMGHVGLTPQAVSVLGGFRAQGRFVQDFYYLNSLQLYLETISAFLETSTN